jgi:hypothetical protein
VRIGHGMKTALRLLFSAEAAGVSPSRGDLVGELCDRGQIGERAAYSTVARLIRSGLVGLHRGKVRLTDDGRAYVRRRINWWGVGVRCQAVLEHGFTLASLGWGCDIAMGGNLESKMKPILTDNVKHRLVPRREREQANSVFVKRRPGACSPPTGNQ